MFIKRAKAIVHGTNNIYIKNAIVLLSDNIVKIVVGFVLSVFIARYFGPERFGQINYVLAFTGILQIFVLFGFDGIVLKDIGLGLYNESNIIGTVIKARLLFALVIYIVGFWIYYFFFDNSLIFIYLILGVQLFVCSFYVFRQWYQVKSLNKYTVIASQITFAVISVAKIALIILSKSVLWYSLVLTIGTLIEVCLLYLFFCWKAKDVCIGKFDIVYCKHLAKASLPLLFQNFAIFIYMKIDQLMIGKMLSVYELGIYSISVTISEIIYFIPMAISNAIYPKIAKAKKDGVDYETLIVKAGSLNFLICMLFAIFCTVFAPFFISTVYGEAYASAGNVIQIYSWASIFVAIGVSHGVFMIFNNIQKYSLYSTVFAAMMNVLGNLICIPLFGIRGAAFTTVISQAFATFFFFSMLKDKRTFVLRSRSLFFRW